MKFARLKLVFAIFLCISLLTISIGFSALSTSLSINGSAGFVPVGMIRIVSMQLDNSENAIITADSYSSDTISTLLDITDASGYVTYNVKISNLGEIDKDVEAIEPIIFSNNDMEYEISNLEINDTIKKKDNREFKITFKYKKNINPTDTKLNVKIKFTFVDHEIINIPVYNYKSEGDCTFGGKGKALIGSCKQENEDFINTNIKAFNSENYAKNFVLKFTIKDVVASRFGAGKRDTIFNMLYEADDKIAGKYPGILLRIEGNKWQLQGGDGRSSATKVQFNKDELLNKEIKIVRYNDGTSIKLYYMIGSSGPFLLRDVTNLYNYFDTPLTFGANIAIDNETPDRYSYATLSNMSFDFLEYGLTLNDLFGLTNQNPDEPDEPDEPTEPDIVFAVTGPCIFGGKNANITGEACSTYNSTNYINSGISLFSSENLNKDFDVSFNIDRYVTSEQPEAQVTLMNAFLERTGRGYGILLRRSNNNLSLIIRDGNNNDKELILSNLTKLRIVRKNKKICYSINDGPFVLAINTNNFSAPFNVPITFGASLDQSGNPFRYIKGTLSNISVALGNIDNSVICE